MDKNIVHSDSLADRRHRPYCIVAYLPRDLDALIAPLRDKYDPDYNIIDSHVTIVFPFESQLPLEELTGAIKSEVDYKKPFEIELESIGDFYPQAPYIYWEIKPNEDLNELYYSLYARLDLPLEFKTWVPHVTVAKEISNFRVMMVKDDIASYLSQQRFEVGAIDLITPMTARRWVSVRTFSLSGFEY